MKEYSPLRMLDVLYWRKVSKQMPRGDVEKLQTFLRQRALDCGCDEGVSAVINGLTERFADEERETMRKVMEERVRRLSIIEQRRIDATDDEIVEAIKMTLPRFKSARDWGGVYCILVEYCHHLGFTKTKTTFVERFARMGIYPTDSVVTVDRSIPPAIYKDEYNDLFCSYSAIDKGVDTYWPLSYEDWQTSNITTKDFIQRRDIAGFFLKNLVKVTEGQ